MHTLRPRLESSIRLTCLTCLLASPIAAQSQAAPGTGTGHPAVPGDADAKVNGPNATLTTSSQHDSSNGWSSLFTPNLSWRFNKHFYLDFGVPIFAYINVDANTGTKAKPVYKYEIENGVVGDTSLGGHYEVASDWLSYTGNLSIGLPSGNTAYGLGAGQVTYNVTNHFEKDMDWFTPDIELGIGDASSLLNQQIQKSYVSVGTLANFQIGGSFDLPHDMSFDVEAYEDLPLAASTIYSTTGKGKKKVTTAVGTSAAEDNGLSASLDIPLNPHVTLSGFYNRSLRDHEDTGGFSLTFVLRAPTKAAAKD